MKEVVVPKMGESITEASIAAIHIKTGDFVKEGDLLFELETDKATMEVVSPNNGVVSEIKVNLGDTVAPNGLLSVIDDSKGSDSSQAGRAASNGEVDNSNKNVVLQSSDADSSVNHAKTNSPAARGMMLQNNINPATVVCTAKGDRISKEDVLRHMSSESFSAAASNIVANTTMQSSGSMFPERVVPMSKLRQKIATKLKESQNNAAMLTTFNEVDMSNIMKMRSIYKDKFEKTHGVKLGFMSFFVKAVISALNAFPELNAEIRGKDIVYKDYNNIGVAVGTKAGLVVPVIKNAQGLSFAGIEKSIVEYGKKAMDGKLQAEDMQGGSFTISNGGIYGSLMSTPIINPPQSGILGMHAIKERPIVVNKEIVIRPMMYLALSYDHRIVDGREAVSFLVVVKEAIENPERLLLCI